jgi:hypothetical protein
MATRRASPLAESLNECFGVFLASLWMERLERSKPVPLEHFIEGREGGARRPIRNGALQAVVDRARGRRRGPLARSPKRKPGRPEEEALKQLVGDLMGCVFEFLGRGLETSTQSPVGKNPGTPSGPVLRFMSMPALHVAQLINDGLVIGSPELSREAARLLRRLTPAALRQRTRAMRRLIRRAIKIDFARE